MVMEETIYNSDWLIYGRQNESIVLKKPGPIVKYEPVYKYKYNGKEYQDEMGLNVTAMDFRMYDNALGRFYGMDKMTDILPSISPYRFAFNNPVKWNDPSGLLEGGGDEDKADVDGGMLELVVVTSYTTSSSKEIKRPANFNYSLIDKNKPHRGVSMDEYNSIKGTNYKTFDDYYFNEKYKPAYKQNISNIHSATNSAAVAVLTTAAVLTGSALAMPVVASASPAIQSYVAVEVTGYTSITGQTVVTGMAINALSQGIANGGDVSKINLIEVASSSVPGVVPTIIGETFNFNYAERSQLIQTPKDLDQVVLQIGGGLLSNYAGGKIDGISTNNVTGSLYKEILKGMVETGSNVAPALAE